MHLSRSCAIERCRVICNGRSWPLAFRSPTPPPIVSAMVVPRKRPLYSHASAVRLNDGGDACRQHRDFSSRLGVSSWPSEPLRSFSPSTSAVSLRLACHPHALAPWGSLSRNMEVMEFIWTRAAARHRCSLLALRSHGRSRQQTWAAETNGKVGSHLGAVAARQTTLRNLTVHCPSPRLIERGSQRPGVVSAGPVIARPCNEQCVRLSSSCWSSRRFDAF